MASDQFVEHNSDSEDGPPPAPPVVAPIKKGKFRRLVPNVDYIPGPLKCPGLYNLTPSNGEVVVRRYAYAIPLTDDEVYGFLDRFFPEPFPAGFYGIPKLLYFFGNFEGRPQETRDVVTLYIPLTKGSRWTPLACIIGYNVTEEHIKQAEGPEVQALALKIQGYFETTTPFGWYRYKRLGCS